ncbi:MAG: hypothetical protein ACI9N1_000054 [Flavobacteriales bacterium]|jgi:hypothetical protein
MMQIEYKLFFILIIFFCIGTSCNSSNSNKRESLDSTLKRDRISVLEFTDTVNIHLDSVTIPNKIKTVDVLVVICYNGYEYAMQGYDFNPIIETELNKFESVNVIPFPYKTLMGVSYQGVFDIKYCDPIIEKVDVDYLVLTRFTGNRFQLNDKKENWGYETRIIDCKAMTQTNSLKASNLNNYKDIEVHIISNIKGIRDDILGAE